MSMINDKVWLICLMSCSQVVRVLDCPSGNKKIPGREIKIAWTHWDTFDISIFRYLTSSPFDDVDAKTQHRY